MKDQEIVVGKYTLESLTTGMYADPKIIYREYIQNSVDSLETAVAEGIISPRQMRIDIIIDEEASRISIRDNGVGIPQSKASTTLMNIGNSSKRQSENRGFRGIGRLGGMSYCETLVFTTSAENEPVKTIVTFDCMKLRDLLRPGEHEDLALGDVISAISTVETEKEKKDKHYFLVELKGVTGLSELLDVDSIRRYISQVAPVDYLPRGFIYTKELRKYLSSKGYEIEDFPIFVGESQEDLQEVYKPHKSRFCSDRKKKTEDDITSMEYFEVKVGEELYAIGWYGNCNWYGTISDTDLSGLRGRKGNILIGDSKTFRSIFKEERFNGWVQGEIFILSDLLIPNARRDDFEQNDAYYAFMKALTEGIGTEISKKAREASSSRNDPSAKILKSAEKANREAKRILDEGFNSSIDKDTVTTSLQAAISDLQAAKAPTPERRTEIEKTIEKLSETIQSVQTSNKYKINDVPLEKKEKKLLKTITEILSKHLAKSLVDEIIEDIIKAIKGK